ncbi:MAG TPA: site-2 protease family protein [Candidatus Bathyarchaeia archaeon]|nr:site-2 protease family protein [Candidatus Bathyarchaeia archaeon]
MSDGPPQPVSPLSTTPAQPPTQTTITVYTGPPLDTIRSIVGSQFQVKDAFLDPYGVPTILVAAEPAKQKFKNILDQLAPYNLLAAIRGMADTLTVKVFQKPQLRPSRRIINLVLFLATVATVTLAGYFLWTGGLTGSPALQAEFNAIVAGPNSNPYLKAASFSAGLLAIIGLHEFGHKAATVHHKLDATLPYFIPGPPPIGTFGALISLRGPPTNRDQLFDLGLSGPVVGFIVTMGVGAASMLLGAPVTSDLLDWGTKCGAQLGLGHSCLGSLSFPGQPLILIFLSYLTNMVRPNVVFDQQLFFAAQIGALLTFLNIVPAWQLDGGHISRAVFGPSGHRIATIVGLMILIFSGFWSFALLVLVMMGFSRRGFAGVEPLDDVSPVSGTRKVLYVVGIAMLVLTFASSPL